MYGSGSTHLQIYKNISAKLTKSLNPNQKEGKHEKNTRKISIKLDNLSAIQLPWNAYVSLECRLRHNWNKLCRIIKCALLHICMGNILICKFIESNQSCLRMIATTVRQRHIQNPVENLRWSFLSKIVNGIKSLTFHTKATSQMISLGSKYASSATVIAVLLQRNVFGILIF